jgi:hypothetical protein
LKHVVLAMFPLRCILLGILSHRRGVTWDAS